MGYGKYMTIHKFEANPLLEIYASPLSRSFLKNDFLHHLVNNITKQG